MISLDKAKELAAQDPIGLAEELVVELAETIVVMHECIDRLRDGWKAAPPYTDQGYEYPWRWYQTGREWEPMTPEQQVVMKK